MKVPTKVTEQMYEAGMTFLAKRGTSWSVKDLYAVMDAVRDYGCQCKHCTVKHTSDCAVHNEPAYPASQCDCAAAPQQGGEETAEVTMDAFIVEWCKQNGRAPKWFLKFSHEFVDKCLARIIAISAAQQEPASVGDIPSRSEAPRLPVHGAVTPVAWRRKEGNAWWVYYEANVHPDLEPLYAAQPAPVEMLELPAFLRHPQGDKK